MPKMKTHSGTKKRVKTSASGKLVRERAFAVHNLSKKSPGRKRNNARADKLGGKNVTNAKRALGA